MIVMCPGCSGIDIDIVKNEFKDEKIVCGCIGECGGRMDGTIVAMVDGELVQDIIFINFFMSKRKPF